MNKPKNQLKIVDVSAVNGRIKSLLIKLVHNRPIFYTIGIVAIIGILIFGGVNTTGTPEFANATSTTVNGSVDTSVRTGVARNDTTSPAQVGAAIQGMTASSAVNFLAFDRWHDMNTLPSPNVGVLNIGAMISGGVAMIGSMLLAISSTIMWLMGLLLAMAMNLDLLGRLSLTIDHTFALITNDLLTNPASTAAIGILIVILIGMTIFRFMKGDGRRALLGLGIGGLAFLALIGMSTQAGKNHNDIAGGNKAPIASLAEPPGFSNGLITATETNVNLPDNWAAFSPGWIVSQTNVILKAGIGIVNRGINAVTDSVGTANINSSGTSICGRYIGAMYNAYDSAAVVSGNGNMDVLKSYDKLVRAVYFEPYVNAAFGDSNGAQNSWCRMAEVKAKSPAGEQAYLSEKAEVYREAIGWGDSTDGKPSLVTVNGNWTDARTGPSQAGDFFGTNVYSPNATDKMINYFAACNWNVSSNAALNPEWNGVLSANSKWKTSFLPWENVDNIINIAEGTTGTLTGTMCSKVATPGMDEFGFNKDEKSSEQFNYKEDPGSVIFAAFGVTGTFAKNFSPAIAQGNIGSYNYYQTTQGNGSLYSSLYGIIILIIIGMMAKYMLPLILGGIVAQALATVALMFLPISILLLIIPMSWSRKLIIMTGATVLSSFLVNLLFVAMTTITLSLTYILMYILVPTTVVAKNIIVIAGGAGSFITVLQTGLAVFLALKVVRIILTKVFAIDMSSLSKAAMSAGLLSGGAMLNAIGLQPPKLLNGRMDAGRGAKDIMNEARHRVGNTLSNVAHVSDVMDGMRKSRISPIDKAEKIAAGGLGGATSTDDLANVTETQGKSALSPNDTTLTRNSVLPTEVAIGSIPTPIGAPGSSLNSQVHPDADNLSSEQQQAANAQISNTANSLLGGYASDDQMSAINQPGDRGDLAALGTTPKRINEIIANNELPAFASNGGASPITTPEAARAAMTEFNSHADDIFNGSQLKDVGLAEKVLTQSILAGNNETGIEAAIREPKFSDRYLDEKTWLSIGAASEFSDVQRHALENSAASTTDQSYASVKSMASRFRRENGNSQSDGIAMVFEEAYLPHESGSVSSGTVSHSQIDFGSDPQNKFEHAGKGYEVGQVAQSLAGLTEAMQQSHEPQLTTTMPEQTIPKTPGIDQVNFLRKVADMSRGPGFTSNVVRWFQRG